MRRIAMAPLAGRLCRADTHAQRGTAALSKHLRWHTFSVDECRRLSGIITLQSHQPWRPERPPQAQAQAARHAPVQNTTRISRSATGRTPQPASQHARVSTQRNALPAGARQPAPIPMQIGRSTQLRDSSRAVERHLAVPDPQVQAQSRETRASAARSTPPPAAQRSSLLSHQSTYDRRTSPRPARPSLPTGAQPAFLETGGRHLQLGPPPPQWAPRLQASGELEAFRNAAAVRTSNARPPHPLAAQSTGRHTPPEERAYQAYLREQAASFRKTDPFGSRSLQ